MSATAADGSADPDPLSADRSSLRADPPPFLSLVEYLAGPTAGPPRPGRHHLPASFLGLLGHPPVRVATGQSPPARLPAPRRGHPGAGQPQSAPGYRSPHPPGPRYPRLFRGTHHGGRGRTLADASEPTLAAHEGVRAGPGAGARAPDHRWHRASGVWQEALRPLPATTAGEKDALPAPGAGGEIHRSGRPGEFRRHGLHRERAGLGQVARGGTQTTMRTEGDGRVGSGVEARLSAVEDLLAGGCVMGLWPGLPDRADQ